MSACSWRGRDHVSRWVRIGCCGVGVVWGLGLSLLNCFMVVAWIAAVVVDVVL